MWPRSFFQVRRIACQTACSRLDEIHLSKRPAFFELGTSIYDRHIHIRKRIWGMRHWSLNERNNCSDHDRCSQCDKIDSPWHAISKIQASSFDAKHRAIMIVLARGQLVNCAPPEGSGNLRQIMLMRGRKGIDTSINKPEYAISSARIWYIDVEWPRDHV